MSKNLKNIIDDDDRLYMLSTANKAGKLRVKKIKNKYLEEIKCQKNKKSYQKR